MKHKKLFLSYKYNINYTSIKSKSQHFWQERQFSGNNVSLLTITSKGTKRTAPAEAARKNSLFKAAQQPADLAENIVSLYLSLNAVDDLVYLVVRQVNA